MINYVYVWFANFRLRFLGCLDWNICFTQIFFSILISVWSFQCTIWLNVYQSSEASILWILWSLVKPVILFLIWQPPAFPYRHQYSIIGRFRLNHRVRDVDGCFPKAHRHQKIASRTLVLHALEVASQLPLYRSLSTSSLSSFFLITEQWITFTRFP